MKSVELSAQTTPDGAGFTSPTTITSITSSTTTTTTTTITSTTTTTTSSGARPKQQLDKNFRIVKKKVAEVEDEKVLGEDKAQEDEEKDKEDDKRAVQAKQKEGKEKEKAAKKAKRKKSSPFELLIKRRKFIAASTLTAGATAAAIAHTASARMSRVLTPATTNKSQTTKNKKKPLEAACRLRKDDDGDKPNMRQTRSRKYIFLPTIFFYFPFISGSGIVKPAKNDCC